MNFLFQLRCKEEFQECRSNRHQMDNGADREEKVRWHIWGSVPRSFNILERVVAGQPYPSRSGRTFLCSWDGLSFLRRCFSGGTIPKICRTASETWKLNSDRLTIQHKFSVYQNAWICITILMNDLDHFTCSRPSKFILDEGQLLRTKRRRIGGHLNSTMSKGKAYWLSTLGL